MKKLGVVVENHSMFNNSKFLNKKNFFQILNIKLQFNINMNILESHYINTINTLESNDNNIFLINKSYYALKDPLLRAQHMLEILKIYKNNIMLDYKMLNNFIIY